MTRVFLPYLWTMIATSAFAIRFGLRLKDLAPAALGAVGGWFVFELASGALFGDTSGATGAGASPGAWSAPTLGYFLAALFIGLYAEVLSALLRKPATIWVVVSIFPLVPGGGMYVTMLSSVRGDLWQSIRSGFDTLSAAGAIASGLAVSSAVSRLISLRSITKRIAEQRQARSPLPRASLSDGAERRSFDAFAGDDDR